MLPRHQLSRDPPSPELAIYASEPAVKQTSSAAIAQLESNQPLLEERAAKDWISNRSEAIKVVSLEVGKDLRAQGEEGVDIPRHLVDYDIYDNRTAHAQTSQSRLTEDSGVHQPV
ncbi:hypothetical protein [Sphingopyxis terrae]|uniref:hypothetical protein n=1 Tax=Sphingopyxis terrae TaxID=33052 RepID=UPI001F622295|nr:hypothetical protein [Sphingopyxis terrae]